MEEMRPDGREQTLLFSYIGYREMKPVFSDEADLRYMYARRLVLFTGIAKDTPLRNYLSDKYKIVKHFHFPDHHKYTHADIRTTQIYTHIDKEFIKQEHREQHDGAGDGQHARRGEREQQRNGRDHHDELEGYWYPYHRANPRTRHCRYRSPQPKPGDCHY